MNRHLLQYNTPVSYNMQSNLYVDNIVTEFNSEEERYSFTARPDQSYQQLSLTWELGVK